MSFHTFVWLYCCHRRRASSLSLLTRDFLSKILAFLHFRPLFVVIFSACFEDVIGGAMSPFSMRFVEETDSTIISSWEIIVSNNSDMDYRWYRTKRAIRRFLSSENLVSSETDSIHFFIPYTQITKARWLVPPPTGH